MFFLLFQLKFTLWKYSYKMLLEKICPGWEKRWPFSDLGSMFLSYDELGFVSLIYIHCTLLKIYLEVTNLFYDQISNSIILVFSSTKLVRFIQLWIIKFISVKRLYWLLGKIFYMLINLLVDTNICNKVLYILRF